MKKWTPVGATLAAAAVTALVARPVLPPRSLPLSIVLLVGVAYVLLILVVSAMALLVTYFIQAERTGFYEIALRTVAGAVWLAPLTLLVYQRSAWAMLASGALVASTIGIWDAIEPGERRRFLSSLSASVCLQVAMVAAIANYTRVGALMAGAGTAALMWARPEREAARFNLPRVVLAIVLTAIALTPYLMRMGGGDDDGGAGVAGQRGAEKGKTTTQALGAGEFPGVILWPEETPHTMLVPPPPSIGRGRSLGNRAKPLSIPFYGAYWFFRWPDKRPPPNSVVARGSTMKTVYRSVDHMALTMEAHQNFGVLIDLSCCQSIDVVIANADPASEGMRLELLLANTALDEKPSISLGRMPVSTAIEETLSFPVRGDSTLRQFDEATVRFHRGQQQWEKSAKIAIERFVLVP